jgi:hypothetical protein
VQGPAETIWNAGASLEDAGLRAARGAVCGVTFLDTETEGESPPPGTPGPKPLEAPTGIEPVYTALQAAA